MDLEQDLIGSDSKATTEQLDEFFDDEDGDQFHELAGSARRPSKSMKGIRSLRKQMGPSRSTVSFGTSPLNHSITLSFPVTSGGALRSSNMNAGAITKETFRQLAPAAFSSSASGGTGGASDIDVDAENLTGRFKLLFKNGMLEKNFRIWNHSVFEKASYNKYLSLFLLEAGFLLTGIIIVAVEVNLDLDFAQEIYMLDTNVSARLENDNADPNITSHFPDNCDASEPMYCTSRGANYYFNSEFFFHLAIAVLFLLDYLYLKLQAPRQWLGNHFSICTAEIQWRCLICATWFLVILLQSLNFFIGDNSIFQSNFALPAGMQLVFYHVSAILYSGLQFKYTLALASTNAFLLLVLWISDAISESHQYPFILFPMIYSVSLYAVIIVIVMFTRLATERWSRHTYMLFLRMTQMELDAEMQSAPFSEENIAKFVSGKVDNESQRTNEAMKVLRERPRGPSLAASPTTPYKVTGRRYVKSHELYLGKMFAAGGSGNIFKAHYRGRTVAAKEILQTDCRTNNYSELSNEAEILQRIDQHAQFHPHLVEFRGLCKHSDGQRTRLMLVMEFCETSLDKLITAPDNHAQPVAARERFHQRSPMTSAADMRYLCFMALHLVDAVAYLHSLDMVHRDIKTDNVFLKRIPNDGIFFKYMAGPRSSEDVQRILGFLPRDLLMPKLGDFGLTRQVDEDESLEHHDCGQGSAMYMPPEALWWHFHNTRTRRASSAASMRKELVTVLDDASRVAQQKSDFVGLDGFKKHDVYSIGMLLLASITGDSLYASEVSQLKHDHPQYGRGRLQDTLMEKILLGEVKPQIPEGCPPILKELILKCTSVDPTARPSTSSIFDSIYQQLDALLAPNDSEFSCSLDNFLSLCFLKQLR